jgi:spore germination protein GerM
MMHRARVAWFLALTAAVAAGCGGEGSGSPPLTSAGTTRTTVYFLTDDGTAPIGVRRAIAKRHPWVREALYALLAGPSDAERKAGITTALPEGARLISVSPRGPGDAGVVVDLSGLAGVYDAADRVRIITQVVRTLIGVSRVERVWLRSDGRVWGLTSHEGEMSDMTYDYDTLAGFWVGPFKALP